MSTSAQNGPIGVTSDAVNSSDQVAIPTELKVPKVIGIYGIPGSGKTTLLSELKHNLDDGCFSFYEGSEVIADMTPGGLVAFQKLDEQSKKRSRQLAIRRVYDDCAKSGKTAIITGHYIFWREEDSVGDAVCTESDLAAYTHIIYMNVPPETIEKRCNIDVAKRRDTSSVTHLSKWQQAELDALLPLCREHNILLSIVDILQIQQRKVETLVVDFHLHDEDFNEQCARNKLDQVVSSHLSQAETVMVIDGDRTLTSQDTGTMFWDTVPTYRHWKKSGSPLKTLFGSLLGYSYAAFRQATLLHEEVTNDEMYEEVCQQVASATILHPEFLSLLQLAANLPPVGAIIVSCGLRRIWEIVLEKANLQETVGIIAGGRIADGLVITATTKATIVTRLRDHHHKRVWAFGDSPLDLEMLKAADQAIVVVTEEHTRSKSMEGALSKAIDCQGLRALQAILPSSSLPRLDTTRLPLIDITKVDFANALLEHGKQTADLSIFIAADTASKLLATPMRDAAVQGPSLRAAHQRAGEYLALQHVSRIVGLEPRLISHVLGRPTSGFQLAKEEQTTIVALMRGGDPMALGVSQAFPQARYVHAKVPQDLKIQHLEGQAQVLLVDSVVNTGKSVIEFVDAIRLLSPDICIIIVAGVVQAQCLYRNSIMYKTLSAHGSIDVVTLRVSDTKFTGSGTTDTGNRLFNTTHMI
ncbi:hypothetical protein NX059_012120 [Plenodomus lindquistii]|nr:hypothetical protein NX059_012120 [Plenodomus lindquistii]